MIPSNMDRRERKIENPPTPIQKKLRLLLLLLPCSR